MTRITANDTSIIDGVRVFWGPWTQLGLPPKSSHLRRIGRDSRNKKVAEIHVYFENRIFHFWCGSTKGYGESVLKKITDFGGQARTEKEAVGLCLRHMHLKEYQ